jgi:peptidoglycan/LPS O-acetylase OafA/YrhL
MNRQFSVYLDLIRFTAAVLVFISHVPTFAGGWLWQLSGFGHEAVVVFFVLSGFVIAYVVYEKNESAVKYTVSRLSRIYSVAVPALLLTFLLYYIGQEINESAFDSLNERLKDPLWTFISAITFTNQSWVGTPILSNLPYWSLGYEVLYYIFFGLLIYAKGTIKILLLALVCLVMGPSILIYLPVWLAGVFCFKKLKVYEISFKVSVFLYALSIIGILCLTLNSVQLVINNFMSEALGDTFYNILLEPADKFFSDYVLTIFVTLHIFSSYHLTKRSSFFNLNIKLESMIKWLSSHTFAGRDRAFKENNTV